MDARNGNRLPAGPIALLGGKQGGGRSGAWEVSSGESYRDKYINRTIILRIT